MNSESDETVNENNIHKPHICKICNCRFQTKWNLDKHLSKKNKCLPSKSVTNQCYICGKNFQQKGHLENHLNRKNKCTPIQNTNSQSNTDTSPKNIDAIAHVIIDKMKDFFGDQIGNKSIENNTNTNSHNTQNTTNNSNNSNNTNTNSHNNTMNTSNSACLINYVVQQYPNAKNIEDCIKLENIPKMTLTECEDLYFTDGAMKIFKGLCDLGEEHRPIHCTDASRCNYIYKSNDVWKIDVGGEAIRNHFFPVIQEAYTQVHKSRIKDNPGNSTVIGNYLTEMTGSNVKKICQKTLKRLSNDFLAKNSKNSKLIKMQRE
jgi:hypothetical protein